MPPSHSALPLSQIAVGDCLQTMAAWPAGSIDLIFADPPYNIGYEYDTYHDKRSDDDYITWTRDWITACTRLLKPSGSLYILIGDEFAAETRLHLKTLEQQKQLAFRNWIVWHYTFGQRCKSKFNRSHAHLFYCVGPASLRVEGRKSTTRTGQSPPPGGGDEGVGLPFTFNYSQAALPSARMTTYNDKRQNPSGKLPDDTWTLKFPAAADWHVRPQDAADEGLFALDSDTWYQSRLCGTFKERQQWHPCQLPEALLERILKVSSNEGDIVFDPFAGSGTTLAVAARLGRRWLGCELSGDYAKKAAARIRAASPGVPKKSGRRRTLSVAH